MFSNATVVTALAAAGIFGIVMLSGQVQVYHLAKDSFQETLDILPNDDQIDLSVGGGDFEDNIMDLEGRESISSDFTAGRNAEALNMKGRRTSPHHEHTEQNEVQEVKPRENDKPGMGRRNEDLFFDKDKEYTVVICIGVAPRHFERRKALRETWLRWVRESDDAMYLFFTEKPDEKARYQTSHEDLDREQHEHKDMIFQEGPSGYNNMNGLREVQHILYFTERFKFKYYLRVDDDGFLCFRQLLEELRWYLPEFGPLLHGKYHCHNVKARMDENYLLMSRGVAATVAQGFNSHLLPFNPKLTFALNLGNVVPLLQKTFGLHVFDDQERFCWPGKAGTPAAKPCRDAWFGLMKRLRNPELDPCFCDQFMWSHWVKLVDDMKAIYELQTNNSNTDTMDARHRIKAKPESPSTRMRHILDLYKNPVCKGWRGFEDGIPYYRTPHALLGPKWGIPGMKPLHNNSDLVDEISKNISALWNEFGDK